MALNSAEKRFNMKLCARRANAIFLITAPFLAFFMLALHLYIDGFIIELWLWAIAYYVLTGFAITAGYHRHFCHNSYKTRPIIKMLFAAVGASALEGSILQWCSDHRRHHKYVDQELDPYSTKRGFLHAHLTWIFKENPTLFPPIVKDLMKNPIVIWQHSNILWLSVVTAFLFPIFLGYIYGSALGGFAIVGLLKIVCFHHGSFLVNSVAHIWGEKPYNKDISACDNLLVAIFTHGEGYHNFHHSFESDYRHGFHTLAWDPTKWFILLLEKTSLATELCRTPERLVFEKKRFSRNEVR